MDEVSSHWSGKKTKPNVKVGHFQLLKRPFVVLKISTGESKLSSMILISLWTPLMALMMRQAHIVGLRAWKRITLLLRLSALKNWHVQLNLEVVVFYWNGHMDNQ